LSQLIAEENKKKPITDEVLSKLMKEKGYIVARRTIAKYREQLDIPVARLRKEL
jgi:RNA polymerase sigma-54 factor